MQRRHLLAAIAGSTVMLGGCLDRNRGSPTPDDDDPASLDASLLTTGSDCATQNDDWAVAFEDGEGVTVEGMTPAPDPCHDARVEDVSLDAGEVNLAIDVASTLEEDQSCVQCVGAVDYRLTLEGDVGAGQRVTVDHLHGGTHNIEVFAADAPLRVEATDIDTIVADCGTDDDVSASVTGPYVSIGGYIPAPDPCHRAALTDASVDDGVLTIDIRAVPDEEAGVCIDCVAAVEYEAQVVIVGPPRLAKLRINHLDAGTHVVDLSDD